MKIFGVRKMFYIPPLICIVLLYLAAAISPSIKVQHVYGIFPTFIFSTDKTLPSNFAATTRGPIIIIRPEFFDNQETVDHEIIHARQAYRTLFFDWLLCAFDREHLAMRECEAYASEIKSLDSIYVYSKMIKEEYAPDLDIKIIENYLTYYVKQNLS